MGVVKPPWISQKWFRQTPFNYCDHFGDKKLLAQLCKICHDEIAENEQLIKEGKDPYNWGVVFERVGKSLAQSLVLIQKMAEEQGIDLDNIPEEEDPYDSSKEPIFKLMQKYGDVVEKTIKDLEIVPIDTDVILVEKVIDALSHSRHYVIAKIGRALSSRQFDLPELNANDGKTSAFLAYIAIQRNCRAMLTLVKHKPLVDLREEHLKFAQLSLRTSDLIKQEFFPLEELEYDEFGYSDF